MESSDNSRLHHRPIPQAKRVAAAKLHDPTTIYRMRHRMRYRKSQTSTRQRKSHPNPRSLQTTVAYTIVLFTQGRRIAAAQLHDPTWKKTSTLNQPRELAVNAASFCRNCPSVGTARGFAHKPPYTQRKSKAASRTCPSYSAHG